MAIKLNSSDAFSGVTLNGKDIAHLAVDGYLVFGPKGAPKILVEPIDTSFYQGSTVGSTVNAVYYDGGYTCEATWYVDGKASLLRGASSLDLSAYTAGGYKVKLKVTNKEGVVESREASVLVKALTAPTIIVQPFGGTIDELDSFTTYCDVDTGGEYPTFTWILDGVDQPDNGGFSHTFTDLSVGTHSIAVRATNSYGSDTSNTVSLTVTKHISLPSFVIEPNGGTIYEGRDFTSSCAVNDGFDPDYTIQWFIDGAKHGNATKDTTHTYSAVSLGEHKIKAEITNKVGTVQSKEATVLAIVAPEVPAFVVNLPATEKIKDGEIKNLKVSVDDGGSPASLVWLVNDTEVANSNSDTLDVGLYVGTYGVYKVACKATNEVGSTTSQVCSLYYVDSPTVITNPEDATINDKQSAKFSASFDAGFDPEGVSYTWYINGAQQNVDSPNLTVFNKHVGAYKIKCKGTNYAGSVVTSEASLIVESSVNKPTFKESPHDANIRDDQYIVDAVIVEWNGNIGTLQWYLDGRPYAGGTQSSCKFENLSVGEHKVYCLATNSAGETKSDVATYKVTKGSSTNTLTCEYSSQGDIWGFSSWSPYDNYGSMSPTQLPIVTDGHPCTSFNTVYKSYDKVFLAITGAGVTKTARVYLKSDPSNYALIDPKNNTQEDGHYYNTITSGWLNQLLRNSAGKRLEFVFEDY